MKIDLSGHFTDLGVLGTGQLSLGFGINNLGTVVGYSTLTADDFGTIHAFANINGIMHDLGTLGGTSSGALGVNDSGDVVGFSNTGAGGNHAFLYRNGLMIDLNSLIDPGSGWTLDSANGINAAGQITGYGEINGQVHAFVLTGSTAVPEPGSLPILVSGLAVMVMVFRLRATDLARRS